MIHLPKHPVFTQCQAHFRQCRMSFYSTCLVTCTLQYRPAIHSKHSLVHCGTLYNLEDSILQIKTENFWSFQPLRILRNLQQPPD